jgi:hypothetical protein
MTTSVRASVHSALAASLALLACAGAAHAQAQYQVRIIGSVEDNNFAAGTFAGVPQGAPVETRMVVNSASFVDSPSFPGRARGYDIVPGTLEFRAGSVVARQRGTGPVRFGVRNNDPRADGLFLTQGADFPTGLPIETGTTGVFGVAWHHTFNRIPPAPSTAPDPTLTDLSMAGTVGTWDFSNLSVYNYTLELNENVIGMFIAYERSIINLICGPSDVAGAGQTIGSDGQLTADDLIVFIGWFFAADARADVAGSGQSPSPDSQFTADDIIVFVNRFFAGC